MDKDSLFFLEDERTGVKYFFGMFDSIEDAVDFYRTITLDSPFLFQNADHINIFFLGFFYDREDYSAFSNQYRIVMSLQDALISHNGYKEVQKND